MSSQPSSAKGPLALPPGLPVPQPSPDGLDTPYWDGARRHELVVQRCNACSRYQWSPELICHHCLSFDLSWTQIEPTGLLYSWQRIWHPATPALADACPYLVVIVELPHADGIRMIGNLVGGDMSTGAIDPVIGMRLSVVFEDHGDTEDRYTLVQWTPAPLS
jgi:uncharacterized protein